MLSVREQKYIDDETTKICSYLRKEESPGMDQFSRITKHIYVTNWAGSCNMTHLTDNHIDLIICIAKEKKPRAITDNYKINEIKQEIIPINNTPRDDISLYFEKAYELIHDAVKEKHNVLIHSQEGLSRSVTIVIYYLMKRFYMTNFGKKMSIKLELVDPTESFIFKLVKFMKGRRPCAHPNPGFIFQLLTSEMLIKKRLGQVVDVKQKEIEKARMRRARKEASRRLAIRRRKQALESDSDSEEYSEEYSSSE